jgi:tRNA (guanine6-N2)-methyltransferase
MSNSNDSFLIKITFLPGLIDIVLDELSQYSELSIRAQTKDSVYLDMVADFKTLYTLRSVLNIYIVKQNDDFNPHFLSQHKSIMGELIEMVLKENKTNFKTFKLSCAGSESKEVRQIQNFIVNTYKLIFSEEADLEVYIGKISGMWEAGVRLTARPLSLRDYKVANIKGGLNPTVAYAMNTFCGLDSVSSYLNVFSGSATLLIEAGLLNDTLQLIGFDIDGKRNALAIENIKKAGLIKKIHLKTADIFSAPDLGMFDVITSDLPFGMQISKDQDLEKLYRCFVEYCEKFLSPQGVLVAYTTEYKLLESILEQSTFSLHQTIDLKIPTSVSVNKYLHPKIFVCKKK